MPKPLPCPKTAGELTDLYYLDMRCHLLETAAALDRIERRGGAGALDEPRVKRLRDALQILASDGGNRAERFLELFSE